MGSGQRSTGGRRPDHRPPTAHRSARGRRSRLRHRGAGELGPNRRGVLRLTDWADRNQVDLAGPARTRIRAGLSVTGDCRGRRLRMTNPADLGASGLAVRQAGVVRWLTLNRPERRNALARSLVVAL